MHQPRYHLQRVLDFMLHWYCSERTGCMMSLFCLGSRCALRSVISMFLAVQMISSLTCFSPLFSQYTQMCPNACPKYLQHSCFELTSKSCLLLLMQLVSSGLKSMLPVTCSKLSSLLYEQTDMVKTSLGKAFFPLVSPIWPRTRQVRGSRSSSMAQTCCVLQFTCSVLTTFHPSFPTSISATSSLRTLQEKFQSKNFLCFWWMLRVVLECVLECMSRPAARLVSSFSEKALQKQLQPFVYLLTEIIWKLLSRSFSPTQNRPLSSWFPSLLGTSKPALLHPRGSRSSRNSSPPKIQQLSTLQECLADRHGATPSTLEAITIPNLLSKHCFTRERSCGLSLSATSSVGAPVRSRMASMAQPRLMTSKLPQSWAQAFSSSIGEMSLPTGLTYTFGNRLSTTTSLSFPLSNMFTRNDFSRPLYFLKSGTRCRRTSGICARLPRAPMKQQLPSCPCLRSWALKLKEISGLSTILSAGRPSQKTWQSQLERSLEGVSSKTASPHCSWLSGRNLVLFLYSLPAEILKTSLGSVDSCFCCTTVGLLATGLVAGSGLEGGGLGAWRGLGSKEGGLSNQAQSEVRFLTANMASPNPKPVGLGLGCVGLGTLFFISSNNNERISKGGQTAASEIKKSRSPAPPVSAAQPGVLALRPLLLPAPLHQLLAGLHHC